VGVLAWGRAMRRREWGGGPDPTGGQPAATRYRRAGGVPQHGAGQGLGHRWEEPRHSVGRWLKPVQVYSNEFEFKLTPFKFCSIQTGCSQAQKF
jgi:hypothetical protein